jgi:hypothetical protein
MTLSKGGSIEPPFFFDAAPRPGFISLRNG